MLQFCKGGTILKWFCMKNFRIFDRYIYVKDIGQGFILPENLDFNECKLWTIMFYIMKHAPLFNAKKVTMKNIKKVQNKTLKFQF